MRQERLRATIPVRRRSLFVFGPSSATLSCRSAMLTCPPATTNVPTSRRVSRNAVSNRKNERWYR